MKTTPYLGSSVAAHHVMQMLAEGKLTKRDVIKASRVYNDYCFSVNQLWQSEMDVRVKRRLDLLLFHNVTESATIITVPDQLRRYLKNILRGHHRELAVRHRLRSKRSLLNKKRKS